MDGRAFSDEQCACGCGQLLTNLERILSRLKTKCALEQKRQAAERLRSINEKGCHD